jgi:hypothetical protein
MLDYTPERTPGGTSDKRGDLSAFSERRTFVFCYVLLDPADSDDENCGDWGQTQYQHSKLSVTLGLGYMDPCTLITYKHDLITVSPDVSSNKWMPIMMAHIVCYKCVCMLSYGMLST